MDMNPYKEMLIDALVGAGFANKETAMLAEHLGHADFIGNKHDPKWRWDRDSLRQLSDEYLQEIYQKIKEYQWAEIAEHCNQMLNPGIILPGD